MVKGHEFRPGLGVCHRLVAAEGVERDVERDLLLPGAHPAVQLQHAGHGRG